ncbi:MAG: signal peptidase II [Planctomycetaceae bacterium]
MTPRFPANRWAYYWLLVIVGVTGDLYSKSAIFQQLGFPNKVGPILWQTANGWLTFRFVTNFNQGALWGIGQGYAVAFAALSIIAVCGVIYWLFFRNAAVSLWLTIALAFVSAGALGNMYDRLALHGCMINGQKVYAVRDFLLFTFGNFHWPVFNFADMYVVTGSIMLILQTLFVQPSEASTLASAEVPADSPPSTRPSSSEPTASTT